MQKPASLILLMPELEQDFFISHVAKCAPHIFCYGANNKDALEIALENSAKPTALLGFLTPIVVSEAALEQLCGAYNLHPGPPDYPGWRPTHLAATRSVRKFGVTFHKMAAEVDTGDILDTISFDVPRNATLEELEAITYQHAVSLALANLNVVVGQRRPNPSKTTKWDHS